MCCWLGIQSRGLGLGLGSHLMSCCTVSSQRKSSSQQLSLASLLGLRLGHCGALSGAPSVYMTTTRSDLLLPLLHSVSCLQAHGPIFYSRAVRHTVHACCPGQQRGLLFMALIYT